MAESTSPPVPDRELTNMNSQPTTAGRRLSTLLPKPTDSVPLPTLEVAVGSDPFEHIAISQHSPSSEVPKFVIPGVTRLLIDGNPISTYVICKKRFNMEQPANETMAEFRRTTVRNHTLRYTLEVIQQPEKARACGAGPRSSADRRPVDPPPVVQLSVYDETDQQDITMFYDAGFMLYASLEIARPIANGRMHAGPTMPVLTGVAVASTAYLDRPKQAGYFIFPDLSVRHEGWYRLKFSLFESIKHPQDADQHRPFTQMDSSAEDQPPILHESMANRLEVQSTPFQVFSAKKFPGLNQSTTLSKVVAEQGCRVRIRRDIRQRKRGDNKSTTEAIDEGQSSYRGTPEMPFVKPEHARTESRNSIDSLYTRPAPPSRNPSIASLTMPSPVTPGQPHMMPMAPPSSFSGRSSLDNIAMSAGFGGSSADSKSYQPTPPTFGNPVSYSQSMSPESCMGVTLPPIQKPNSFGYDTTRRLYDLPDSFASKRSYSPHAYSQNTAMKSGARPDTGPQPLTPIRPAKADDIIEADDGDSDGEHSDDSLLEGDYTYPRADGSRGTKVALMVSRRR